MYCPQCGLESPQDLQYCRSCGANLKVIGKALTLSEAIARSDRGPLPKLKEMVKNFKVDQVTEEVSRAFDKMNKEIVKHSQELPSTQPWWHKFKKTARERRDEHITKGIVSMFSGVGLMVFLYYLTGALVLKVPPEVLAKIPFELDPVVHVIWLVGLIPLLTGAGRVLAGLMIRPGRYEQAPKFANLLGAFVNWMKQNRDENGPSQLIGLRVSLNEQQTCLSEASQMHPTSING